MLHLCTALKNSLLLCTSQPFWPTGSGIAKGFLGGLDAAWTIRHWAMGEMTDLEVIAERESIFRILPQVSPDGLRKDNKDCTIDPRKRYNTKLQY